MNPRAWAWIMAAAVAVYALMLGSTAVRLVASGDPVAVVLGAAILVFPLLGVWSVWRELRFGMRMQHLSEQWHAGAGADQPRDFDAAREQAREHPEDWRAWYALGLAYDAAQDRRRAREAMRQALAVHP